MKVGEPMDVPISSVNIRQFDGAPVHFDGEDLQHRSSRISLKQWRLFHAIVDCDGFVGAANKLHVSQSSLSHAMAKLQDQLGIPLLTLKGRKAHITEEGKVLLERSRNLVKHAVDVEEVAQSLRLGWEPEVRLAIEPNVPSDLLVLAFRELTSLPRKIRLNVEELSVAEIRQLLHDDRLDLAITTEMILGFIGKKLIEIEYVAVAHPDNPLFDMGREITYDLLRTQLQIVLSDVDESAHGSTVHSPKRLKMNTLDSAIEALRYGLGFAWLPRYRVQPWLDGGQIRILPLNSGSNYITPMYLMLGRSVAVNSGAKMFADALQSSTNGRSPNQAQAGP
jgi:DNA-binding transcriptional LysR family regulator